MSVYVRDLDYMVPTGPLSLSYLYFSVVHFFTFFSFCPTFRNFLRVNLIFVSLLLFYFLPRVVGRLQQQHPCFGAACRLAKRWLGAQLFSDDMTEDTADLLVASVFLQPAPFTPPG